MKPSKPTIKAELPAIYRTTFYKVTMMGGKEYKLDPEEVAVVKAGMQKGGFIQIKQAIINASSISSIEVDEDRSREWRKEFMNVWEDNERNPDEQKALPEPKLLSDQFNKKESRAVQQLGHGRS